ncbi:hypothetical protein B0H14DRAFT_3477809 [Mycena olivaceomarginata]|nr:hypothetical protein B0H14DRAFT_3477809 [Mycena olivaceomarginata]
MSSAASLIALVVLENLRVIPKTKTVVFDSQIYLGSSEPVVIVSLRYFNGSDTAFPDDSSSFNHCITITVVSPRFLQMIKGSIYRNIDGSHML